jgi:hypothetical protein
VTSGPGGWPDQTEQKVLHLMGHRPCYPDLARLGSGVGTWIAFGLPFLSSISNLRVPCVSG